MSERNEASGSSPRVSIGIPVHDGERFVAEAIESILSQTFGDFELIVCDNASSDRTDAIVRELAARDSRIRYHRNGSNLGAAANFNRCFELARGEYFKWCAHDDRLEPTYLERCVEILDASGPEVALCFPQRVIMTHDGRPLGPDPVDRWFEASHPYDRISFARVARIPDRRHPEVAFALCRAEALRKTRLIGAYNLADLVLTTELRLAGEFRQVPQPLFLNRGHDEHADFRRSRRTRGGEASWYDPRRRRGPRWPGGKVLLERMRAILRSDLPGHRKLAYAGATVWGQAVVRTGTRMAVPLERLRASAFRAWESGSVRALRSDRSLLACRLWALFGGIHRRQRDVVALAFARPSPATRSALYGFVGERLARRRDEPARSLLREWADHGDAERARVARAGLTRGAP